MAAGPPSRTAAATPAPKRPAAAGARLLAQIRQAEGAPKRLLYIGTAIVALFLILAIFAPLIAPYGFDQVDANGDRFPKQASPSSAHPFGTTVQSTDVLSRVIWGSRTAIEVVVLSLCLLDRDRRARWASSRAMSAASSTGGWC